MQNKLITAAFGICFAIALFAIASGQQLGGGGSSGGGGTPGGSSLDVQCNVSSAFAACAAGRIIANNGTLYLNPSGSNALVIGATTNGTSGIALVPAGGSVSLQRPDNGAFANIDGASAAFNSNVQAAYFINHSGATLPSISGCSADTQSGGPSAGLFVSRTTGACTVTITFGNTAFVGWGCAVNNQTTANLMRQSATTQTTAVVSGTTVTGDTINFSCVAF